MCRPPYIRMYQVELVPAPVTLVGERKSMLLPKLEGFTNLCLPATKFGQSEHVEIQAQHRPDRLKKPRTELVGTDRLGRVPSRLGPIGYAGSAQRADDARKDIPLGIYFGVSVGALNEH